MNMKRFGVISIALFALFVFAIVTSYQLGVKEALRQASVNIDVGTYSIHVTVWIQRAGESEPTFWSHHSGVLTNVGKDFIEGKLGNSAFANATSYAVYISLSSDTSAPSSSWINIPAEITSGGLERAAGTYQSTGTGVWTISHQFTASATQTNVQLTGLNWNSGANTGSLMCSDTFTAVTLNSGDKLTITWTITVS